MGWIMAKQVFEETTDGSETSVARGRRVSAPGLQLSKEHYYSFGVQIAELQVCH